jgi:hypothetical protein
MLASFSAPRALAVVVLLSHGLPGFAQIVDSSNPQATVPQVTYRSVFRETSLGIEQEKVDWRKANDDVGKFIRGHLDIIKQEEIDSKAPSPRATPVAPATPHKH